MDAQQSKSLSSHLLKRLSNIFDKYDEKKSGFVHQDKFKEWKKDFKIHEFSWKTNDDGLVSKEHFLQEMTTAILEIANQMTNSPFTKLTDSKTPSTSQFEMRIGDVTNAKTKIDVRYEVNGGISDHFNDVKKSLSWKDETVGIIIKIHSKQAKQAAEKLQVLVDELVQLASAMIPFSQTYIDDLKIEVKHEGDTVFLTLVFKDDFEISHLLFYIAVQDRIFGTHKSNAEVSIEAKHDFNSLLGESKEIIKLVTEGLKIHFHLQTDSTEASLNVIETIPFLTDFKEFGALATLFVQKDFNLSFSIGDLKFKEVVQKLLIPGSADILEFNTGTVQQILPMAAGPAIEMIKNPPMPILTEVHDFFLNHIEANFSVTLKLPILLMTVEVKTGGIKEVYQNLLLQS
jgi:hypothetical protein